MPMVASVFFRVELRNGLTPVPAPSATCTLQGEAPCNPQPSRTLVQTSKCRQRPPGFGLEREARSGSGCCWQGSCALLQRPSSKGNPIRIARVAHHTLNNDYECVPTNERKNMSLITLVVTLIVVGILLWLINT